MKSALIFLAAIAGTLRPKDVWADEPVWPVHGRKAYTWSASSDERKKDAYQRGDVDDCSSLSWSDDMDGNRPPLPCRGYMRKFPDMGPELPPNLLTTEVYVGLSPGRKTVAPSLTTILSREWDNSLDNMKFMVQGSYSRFFSSDSEDDSGRSRGVRGGTRGPGSGTGPGTGTGWAGNDGGRGWGGGGSGSKRGDNRDLVVVEGSSGTKLRYLISSSRDVTGERPKVFDMHHTQTVSELLTKHGLRWWWRISITYECVWDDDDTPVGPAVMEQIDRNMTSELEVFSPDVSQKLQTFLRDGLIRFRTEEEGIPSEAEDDGDDEDQLIDPVPIEPPPTDDGVEPEPEEMTMEPLDATEWDWRRYLGLCLVVFWLTITLILVILGARRRRRKEQQENWGNLATEEGVEKLLTTGWALKGSQMQIFDKEKLGYLEDDSVFLGGFEQVAPVIGSEIAVTHPETETTRDVGGLATIADTNSQKPSTVN